MNKRLIIIFVSIAVVILSVVLGAVVFTVGDITVAMSDDVFDKAAIVEASGIKQGTSIFAVDEERAISNIELRFPEAKVVKVERVFPSQVRIEVAKRYAMLLLPVKDKPSYFVLDREMKIVKVCDNNQVAKYEEEIGYTLTEVTGYAIEYDSEPKTAEGGIVKTDGKVLKGISDVVLALDNYCRNDRLCAMMGEFEVRVDNNMTYITVYTRRGAGIEVNLDMNLTPAQQMPLLYDGLDGLTNEERESDIVLYLTVDQNNNPKVARR